MNELAAINLILDELGTHQVSTKDNAHPDVKTARLHIGLELESLLTRGYWFNTMEEVYVPAQSNGYVILGTNVLEVQTYDATIRSQYVKRGRYMWNVADNTRVIAGGLTLNQFIALEFDDLPVNAANAIANAAASAVVSAKLSDTVKANGLAAKAIAFEAMLDADELRVTTPNMFQPDRISVKMARFRRRS